MMFIGRVPLQQIGKLLGVVALIGVVGITMVMLVGTDEKKAADKQVLTEQVAVEKEEPSMAEKLLHRMDTWKARINKFLSSEEVAPEDYDLDKDAQVGHANIAIASSNIVGKGPGNSNERDFLSQAFSDFIYAIIIEEMGIEGAAMVALLYIILLFRTGRIANRCENSFPALLAMGIALLLVTQALFNMLVAVGLAPVTGQPLPLISKGGTSTIINCIYIGVILSISRSARKKEVAGSDKQQGMALAVAS
jgi:cell division protein FtsW